MELILLIVIAVLAVISIVLSLVKGNNHAQAEQLQTALRQQMQENREELNRSIRELRMEMTQTLNQNMQQLQDVLHKNMMTSGELQRQKFDTMARQQEVLIKSTEKRLDDMRLMVEEKLQKTLNERIGQSFEIVRSQLENVQKGLGEMKSLAQDVGGLKKVLSNVKMRGTFGEVQLGALLEQMMSPEQYDANVKTKKSGTEFVEFAIKLPGKDDTNCIPAYRYQISERHIRAVLRRFRSRRYLIDRVIRQAVGSNNQKDGERYSRQICRPAFYDRLCDYVPAFRKYLCGSDPKNKFGRDAAKRI